MSLELITFEFCPFCQRCLIALHEKGIAFDTTYVDLKHPPGWFADVSPLQKVPVLRVRGRAVFDSSVINDYLDESVAPALHPADPLERALHRSWIAFAGELLAAQLAVFKAKSHTAFEKKLKLLDELMVKLGVAPVRGPYFGGGRFSLVDAAYAPFFIRARMMAAAHEGLRIDSPVLGEWSDALLQRPSVIRSIPAGFDAGYRAFIADSGSWLLESAGSTP